MGTVRVSACFLTCVGRADMSAPRVCRFRRVGGKGRRYMPATRTNSVFIVDQILVPLLHTRNDQQEKEKEAEPEPEKPKPAVAKATGKSTGAGSAGRRGAKKAEAEVVEEKVEVEESEPAPSKRGNKRVQHEVSTCFSCGFLY